MGGLPPYLLYMTTGVILIPGMIFAAYASARTSSVFNKYSRVPSSGGLTGADLARAILRRANINAAVVRTGGRLTDYYSHKEKKIALSDSTYDSASVAAIGIAAHEAGHALQYKDGYFPIKLRAGLAPLINVSSALLWPLVAIGLMLGFVSPDSPIGFIVVAAGVILFGLALIFGLITLPAEIDASKRAYKILKISGVTTSEEAAQAKKVLDAAALTYVAALIASALNLIRLLALVAVSARKKR